MQQYEIELTDAPSAADEAVIDEGLAAFNAAHSDYHDKRPLAALARDTATGRTLGGIVGRTSLGLLFIDLVYLPEALRGQDLGTRMMAIIEQEAVRRGCRWATLMTITFQAPKFYERLGWREFGRMPSDPPGTFRVFMQKTLVE